MKKFQNIEKGIFIPALIVVTLLILPLYLFPKQSAYMIQLLYAFCTQKLGWLYIVTCLTSFGFLLWLTFSKYANVKFGKPEEKPEHSNFAWIAMMFTAGVGASIVIMGFLEPLYYLMDPPLSIEPYSQKAYEYAHMYGQFHWGLSAWNFYNPAIVAVAYAMFVRKEQKMRISTACRPILGKKVDGWFGHLIDIFVIFGIIGSIGTSLGIGTPVVSDIIRDVFNIGKAYELQVQIVVLGIWILLFTGTLYLGLEKGLKNLSTFNVWLAFAVMFFILFAGPTVSMIKSEINSLGLYASNFIRMNTYMPAYKSESFVERWTIFYWGWWIAFMPMMGMFVARISRGRTIKNVIWGQLIWGTLGCCSSFMIFGGYSLYLQENEIVDVATILESQGQSQAIIAILRTLPFSKIVMIVICLLCFIYLATTIDSCAYVLAGTTTKSIGRKEEPARWNRILWSLIFCALSIGLMIIGGLKAIETVSIIVAVPLIGVIFLLICSTVRILREDDKEKTEDVVIVLDDKKQEEEISEEAMGVMDVL